MTRGNRSNLDIGSLKTTHKKDKTKCIPDRINKKIKYSPKIVEMDKFQKEWFILKYELSAIKTNKAIKITKNIKKLWKVEFRFNIFFWKCKF